MRALALLGVIVIIHAAAGLPVLMAMVIEFPARQDAEYVNWQTLTDAYAHVALFIPIICIISASALIVAFSHIYTSRYRLQAILIVAIGILCGAVFAWADSEEDNILLFELKPALHFEQDRACALSAVTHEDISLDQCDEFDKSSLTASVLANDSKSLTRTWYLIALAYAIALVIITFLFLIFFNNWAMQTAKLKKAMWCTCISAVALICWFPFRSRYNIEIKSELFGEESIKPFIEGIDIGIGLPEFGGIVLLGVALFVVIWRFSNTFDRVYEIATKTLAILGVLGITGFTLGEVNTSSLIDHLSSSMQTLAIWGIVCFVLAISIPLSSNFDEEQKLNGNRV